MSVTQYQTEKPGVIGQYRVHQTDTGSPEAKAARLSEGREPRPLRPLDRAARPAQVNPRRTEKASRPRRPRVPFRPPLSPDEDKLMSHQKTSLPLGALPLEIEIGK